MINLSSCASSDLIKVFCRHISATKHKDTHIQTHTCIYTYIFMCSASVGYGNPPNSAPVFIAWSPLLSPYSPFEQFFALLCYVCSLALLLLFLSLSSLIRLSFSLTFGGHKLKHPTAPGGQYQGTRPICRSIISLCNHSMHHEEHQLAAVCVSVCVAALTLFQNCLKITINQG